MLQHVQFHRRIAASTLNLASSDTNLKNNSLSDSQITYLLHESSSWNFPPPSTIFSSAKSLKQTQQLHAFATIYAILPHTPSICACLIQSYGSFGRPDSSLRLFHQTPPIHLTAFFCNTLARSFSDPYDRFHAYNWMLQNGIQTDHRTFPNLLKACVDTLEVQKGKEIHCLVLKLGFDSDLYVGNTLLLFYGRCGNVEGAEKVFHEMSTQNIVSWNTFLGVLSVNGCFSKVLSLFREMNRTRFILPDEISVVTILPICAEIGDKVTAGSVHCFALKMGFYLQVTVGNALIDVYGKCWNSRASKKIFDEMVFRNVISWNALITSSSCNDSLKLLILMIRERQKPDSITISNVLPLVAESNFSMTGKEIHAYAIRTGLDSDIFIANSLIYMYAKSGLSDQASHVFALVKTKTIITWNVMIANCAHNRVEIEALHLLRIMQTHGEKPDEITLANVLPVCSRSGFVRQGKEIHAWLIRNAHALNQGVILSNALMDMYAKCGYLNLAGKLFNNISFRDEVTYNILILAYSQTSNDDCKKSLYLFSEMELTGLKCSDVSFMGAISACANLGSIIHGKAIHRIALRVLGNPPLIVRNSLLELYTKCGLIDIARRVFEGINKKDVASWNIMILAYAMLGESDTSLELFEAMRKDGTRYDSGSYIAVLTACSHGGFVEKGRRYFKEMVDDEKIMPAQMHYGCMVDLLGRAGQLEEAAEFIRGLPVEPDANVWGPLLGACRVYGNLELGCWAGEHLLGGHLGYTVLACNMYAEAGKWDEVNRVRSLIKKRKNKGCSWVG